MKKLRITIENKSYEVSVEVLEDDENNSSIKSTTVHGTPLVETEEIKSPESSSSNVSAQPAGEGEVVAPMAGSVFEIQVNVGDQVKRKQSLIVLEAMKMETIIRSQKDGSVESINVKLGDAVQEGEILIKVV